MKNKRPTWCYLLSYFTSYVLNMFRTLIYPSSGAYDYSVELPHWSYCSWFEGCNTDTTPTQPDRNSNTHRTKNNTTNLVIQQNSRKLLMMDILMSETCWAHKKWNKIASDMKLVSYSSTVTMMHGPINLRFTAEWDGHSNNKSVSKEVHVSKRTKRKLLLQNPTAWLWNSPNIHVCKKTMSTNLTLMMTPAQRTVYVIKLLVTRDVIKLACICYQIELIYHALFTAKNVKFWRRKKSSDGVWICLLHDRLQCGLFIIICWRALAAWESLTYLTVIFTWIFTRLSKMLVDRPAGKILH